MTQGLTAGSGSRLRAGAVGQLRQWSEKSELRYLNAQGGTLLANSIGSEPGRRRYSKTASMERFEAEEAAWEIDRMVKSQNSPSWEGSAVC